MALDFPNSPTLNQVFAVAGATWTWDGVKWAASTSGGPSSTAPIMDGTAAVGTGTTWARADHVHPSDTSRMPLAGVVNGSDAPAGQVGEIISSNITSPVTLLAGTPANIAGITLTAGDWDVAGEVWAALGTGGSSGWNAAINSVSATVPSATALNTARSAVNAALTASTNQVLPLRTCRVSLTPTTIYYLVAQVNFPSGTVTGTGNIVARRAR